MAENHLEIKVSEIPLIEKDKEAEDTPLQTAATDKSNERIVRKQEKCKVEEMEKISIGAETTGRVINNKTEVIILDEAPTTARDTRSIVKNGYNPRVIELSDKISKMELRREFEVDVTKPEHSAGGSVDFRRKLVRADDDDSSAEILSRLPPGTILIKQSSSGDGNASAAAISCSREDSDYVHDSSKDSTETNSSGSSSAASYTAAGKSRRIQHRTARSKKIVEVRRNPVRNKKKKPVDEDFSRPRQRLLSVKRKAGFVVDAAAQRKRVRTTPTPYMNTRSVTRKMYTVGATYQAPTIHDATEWKEWPAHGMHERPIWHPQVGLAFEYVDRNFVSLDGRTYREIVDEPVIEVVSVDPHPERLLFSNGKRKREGKTRANDFFGTSIEAGGGEACAIEQASRRSFEACMHGSLHSVLAYCSRVVTPAYKKNVDTKIRRMTSQCSDVPENSKATTSNNPSSDFLATFREDNKVGVASLMPAANSRNAISESTVLPSTSAPPSEISAKCSVMPRRTISFTNVRNMQGNILQEVFNRSSKNTLIFLKPTDPPIKFEKNSTKTSSALVNKTIVKDNAEAALPEMNLTKLDDNAISDEALMEMSSIYKKFLPNSKTESSTSSNSSKTSGVTGRIGNVSASTKSSQEPRDSCKESTNPEVASSPRFACSNQAAEIAKILAEYNEKAANNSSRGRRTSTAKTIKFDNECSVSKNNNRTTYLSLVEQQPKKLEKLKRDEDNNSNKSSTYLSINAFSTNANQDICKPPAEVASNSTAKKIAKLAEESGKDTEDSIRAMDLTTAKPPTRTDEKNMETDSATGSPNRKWLQELIEDTALLYCAAAGVHQADVADYLDTLDSTQSMQWLGS